MERQHTIRFPPKRLRLVGILCGSVLGLLLLAPAMIGIAGAIAVHPGLYTVVLIVLLICVVITIPYLFIFALWALVRLLLNLPAVILTPAGVINHSIVYHVVLPWDEIDHFTRVWLGKGRKSVNVIQVYFKDDRQVYAQQQTFTRLLLRVFGSLIPTNINTRTTAGTQEQVWGQLQRYVREHVPNKHIKFDSIM